MISHVTSCKHFRAYVRLCQVKNHVQTARESHDLNMNFYSFDNGFKQLCATNSMQEFYLSHMELYVRKPVFRVTDQVRLNYSKTCLKRPLKKETNIGFQERLSLNAGQKYCRMLQESILQFFLTSSSYYLSLKPLFCLFLSGHLRQVLL